MSTQPAPDLATLNRDIAQLETEVARREIERKAVASTVRKLAREQRRLRLAKAIRQPAASFPAYKFAVLAIAPLVAAVSAMIVLSLLFNSWNIVAAGSLVAFIAAAIAFGSILFRPDDALLPDALAEVDAKLDAERARLEEAINSLADVNARLAPLLDERRGFAQSDKLQRAMLLQRNWKNMRGTEWEDFVVEVCRTLGANVYRGETPPTPPPVATAPATGPRGVVRRAVTPLFVTFSPRRFAVAAVSEIRPFHTAAVQQIAAELAPHSTDALAIITNTRVTSGSKDLARGRNCTLLGEDEFPDFVLGKITL